jgi:hypothetical protein
VNWGDGSPEEIITDRRDSISHTYSAHGIYNVWIRQSPSKTLCNFRLGVLLSGEANSAKMIQEVVQWGTIKLDSNWTLFGNCSNLHTLPTIPATFDMSNSGNWYRTWIGCSSLTSFPTVDTSNATLFQNTWDGCSSLTTFPSIDTSNAIELRATWNACSSLTTFPSDLDTSNVTNMSYTWNACSSLTTFPSNLDTSNVTNISWAWNGCSSLTTFPSIDTSSVTDMSMTWEGCSSLTLFPSGLDTSSVTNMSRTWYGCSGLISFPSGLDTSSVTNMSSTWYGCSSLTTFPSIDISSATSMSNTWLGCSGLTSFDPFLNTTYAASEWAFTWGNTNNLTMSMVSNNPFSNIGANTIVIDGNSLLGYYNPFTKNTSFRPKFDVSNSKYFSDIYLYGSGITTLADFEIIGFDNMTFPDVNNVDYKEIQIPSYTSLGTVADVILEEIITKVHSNRANHTVIEDPANDFLEMDLGDASIPTNVQTKINDLIADGWIITSS